MFMALPFTTMVFASAFQTTVLRTELAADRELELVPALTMENREGTGCR